ncbi:uncharacterized protein LOC135209531 [Macrobrachium nipponense]|uniref:uncharacterized protein LOC135209531 n=1 Tax=Macrobrachium nipponense TaxID=159736 RepID=UPI0030C88CA1
MSPKTIQLYLYCKMPYTTTVFKMTCVIILAAAVYLQCSLWLKLATRENYEYRNTKQKRVSISNIPMGRHTPPVLSNHCYRYGKLAAVNQCCRMYDYGINNRQNILECAARSPAWFDSNRGLKTSKLHWMFVGDSHIRNLYDVLIRRLKSPLLVYRKKSYREGLWRKMDTLLLAKYQGIPVLVKHLKAPLLLTFTWSPLLELLPNLTKEWLNDEETPPTLVVMGSALHWTHKTWDIYKNIGAEEAAELYKEYISSLSDPANKKKLIQRRMSVVFKLLDHLPASSNNITNIDTYNRIASEVLPAEVVVWSSTIPLSDLYVKECERKKRDTPETKLWRCKDEKHTGYVVIQRYVDMLLNYGCNHILNLESPYCRHE